MDFYFRRVGFLSALAPYDGSYWRGLAVDSEEPPAVEVKARVEVPRASGAPQALEAPPRRCRVHQRRASPPPLRACLLCRLAAAKA